MLELLHFADCQSERVCFHVLCTFLSNDTASRVKGSLFSKVLRPLTLLESCTLAISTSWLAYCSATKAEHPLPSFKSCSGSFTMKKQVEQQTYKETIW